MTVYVALVGALLTALGWALGGAALGVAALVGSAFAFGDWVLMRWLAQRLLLANERGRTLWGGLLVAKMVAVLAVAWLLLWAGGLDPVGFALGVSALVAGGLLGAVHAVLAGELGGPPEEPDADGADAGLGGS